MKSKNEDLLLRFAKNNNTSADILKSKERDFKKLRKKCCLELFNNDKLSIKEIANLLNRSVGTIYAILNYSKTKQIKSYQTKDIFIKNILNRKKELLKELKLVEDVLSGYDLTQE